jgi:hypothetical protein
MGKRHCSHWLRFLKSYRAITEANDTDKVFSFTKSVNTADLITAGIPLFDKDGNEILFHSLRNSYISFSANSNTPHKVIQELAGHSDPRLTFNTYARTLEKSKTDAVKFLPNFATVFNEETVCGNLCNLGEIQCVPVEEHRELTAFLPYTQIPEVGLEPI